MFWPLGRLGFENRCLGGCLRPFILSGRWSFYTGPA